MNFFPNTIINFHAINDQEWMNKVLLILKNRYQLISIQELEEYFYTGKELKNACCITYDDGHESFYTTVFSLLKRYRIPATIFVSPLMVKERRNFWFQEIQNFDEYVLYKIIQDLVPGEWPKVPISIYEIFKRMKLETTWKVINQYMLETNTEQKECVNMNLEQLIEIQESGLVTIGAHTLNHPVLSNEDDNTATNEIRKSIENLSHMLGINIKYFAYPNGIPNVDFSKREMDILANSGIKLSFSTENKTFSKNDNPLSIPRNGLTKGGAFFILTKLLLGRKWETLKKRIKSNSIHVVN